MTGFDERPGDSGDVGRRDFLRLVGGAAVLAAGGSARAVEPAPAKPAEVLVREFFAGLTAEQRRHVVLPWDHAAKGASTRLTMTDTPINRRMGEILSKPQQELAERILRALCADEDGYRRLSRNGVFDDPNGFRSCGVNVFGDPAGKDPFACVFTGHHLTVRCVGNAGADVAFGGPTYFGHVAPGYSRRNVYYHQTRAVLDVFDALSDRQRQSAVVRGTPGDFEAAVRFRPDGQRRPGINISELTPDQSALVEQVMRSVLSSFRRDDVDDVMRIVNRNGGFGRINLAFYEDGRARDGERWHYWRLEGPGFVWNYRVLPHVHCYVNVGVTEA
jgi:hypothetical protein